MRRAHAVSALFLAWIRCMSLAVSVAALGLTSWTSAAGAGSLDHARLAEALDHAVAGFGGVVGVCACDAAGSECIRGAERFPMQSVMKLVVAIAVLDAVDREVIRLADPVVVKKEDLSVFVQPLKKLVTADGYRTTVGDLLSRMVVDSDSAAVDILLNRLGGPPAVQAMLERHHIDGIRVDRDERHLQTDIVGLTWKPEYVDARVLKKAIAAVSEVRRQEAFDFYLADPRDTATPEGMVALLTAVQAGRLLSDPSTLHLLGIMSRTVTFPDRLKAGLLPGWVIGHKTGTSLTWKGITAATNDVGILTAPDGGGVTVAVFIKASGRPEKERASLIADVARRVVSAYR